MPQPAGVRHRRLDGFGQARPGAALAAAGILPGRQADLRRQGSTGFGLAVGRELADRLRQIERTSPAFAAVPRQYLCGARWVEPKLVAEVAFTSWTSDGVLRHPSFEGLREDKPARDVKLERPRPSTRSGRPIKLG